MRGEHHNTHITAHIVKGSSPHARGARNGAAPQGRVTRIIPACAGSTTITCSVYTTIWDHPRMRGEHQQRHQQYRRS